MNFLNPAVLFGLIAAGAPLLIHLLSKRRAREIPFPSIMLLKEMRSDSIRLLKLKQIAMLILRTLVIILIVLAFARPALKSVFRENARTAAVVIIDGSASMDYVDGGETLFARALRTGAEILMFFKNDDSAAVIISGTIPELLESGMTRNKNRLLELLKNRTNPGAAGAPTRAFALAFELLSSTEAVNMEVYYVTDGAENALPDSLPAGGPPNVRIYAVPLGPHKREGTVIRNLRMIDRVAVPGRKITFSAAGYTERHTGEAEIEFFVNGERKGRSETAVRSDGSLEASFDSLPETPGWYSVYAATGEGYFEPGETRRITVYVPEPIRILLVGGVREDMRYIEQALEPEPDSPFFSVKTVLQNDLAESDFASCDAVILSGVTELSERIYRSIVRVVMEDGKGILVFPPQDVSGPLYRDGIFRDILPLTVEGPFTSSTGTGASGLRMERIDFAHPIFRDMSERGEFRRPDMKSYLKMNMAPQVLVIARFGDGSAAVGETACGKGRAVVCAFGASDPGGIVVTGLFVPFMIRTIQYVSGIMINSGLYETGDGVAEVLGDIPAGSQVILKAENRPAELVNVRYTGGHPVTVDLIAGAPGFYSLTTGGDRELLRYSVNAPGGEVVFSRFDTASAAHAFKGVQLKEIDESVSLAEFITRDRFGKELTGWFIVCALMLLAAEMVLARKV